MADIVAGSELASAGVRLSPRRMFGISPILATRVGGS